MDTSESLPQKKFTLKALTEEVELEQKEYKLHVFV